MCGRAREGEYIPCGNCARARNSLMREICIAQLQACRCHSLVAAECRTSLSRKPDETESRLRPSRETLTWVFALVSALMPPLSPYWSVCVVGFTLAVLRRWGCGECKPRVCASTTLGVQVFGAVHITLPAPNVCRHLVPLELGMPHCLLRNGSRGCCTVALVRWVDSFFARDESLTLGSFTRATDVICSMRRLRSLPIAGIFPAVVLSS